MMSFIDIFTKSTKSVEDVSVVHWLIKINLIARKCCRGVDVDRKIVQFGDVRHLCFPKGFHHILKTQFRKRLKT